MGRSRGLEYDLYSNYNYTSQDAEKRRKEEILSYPQNRVNISKKKQLVEILKGKSLVLVLVLVLVRETWAVQNPNTTNSNLKNLTQTTAKKRKEFYV